MSNSTHCWLLAFGFLIYAFAAGGDSTHAAATALQDNQVAASAASAGSPAAVANWPDGKRLATSLLSRNAQSVASQSLATAAQSRVPKWDARGLGPLPWQGIACIDMSDDGRHIAVGTIAPPGDPNVFLLDGDGKLASQFQVGVRWIDAVAVADDGRFVWALCGTPQGHSGDGPEAFALGGPQASTLASEKLSDRNAAEVFHYGDHSNHLAAFMGSAGRHIILAGANQLVCVSSSQEGGHQDDASGRQGADASGRQGGAPAAPDSASKRRLQVPAADPDAATTVLAVSPSGRAVVGCTRQADGLSASRPNLLLYDAQTNRWLWSRAANTRTDAAPPMEKGIYGPPAPPYEDLKLWAPLAAAVDRQGKLVAAADYQGWERVFVARGPRRRQSYGIRFMPSRPTVEIYDAQGQPLRRFGPETFAEPFWCDMLFSAAGDRLLVFPRSWRCRGLAGQPLLPTDAPARKLYVLPVGGGAPIVVPFPDAISSVAVAEGITAVGCWDGRVYLLDENYQPLKTAPQGVPVGGSSLVRATGDGSRILVAVADGRLRMLDNTGATLWQLDLNRVARKGEKPWTINQKAGRVAPGIWSSNSGRTHSDLGGQYVIEAPHGLILIDPNAGLSLEQNWARIEGAGLDPRQVRYVLLTHEHGDHAPGAYLWRVLTGAQVVASVETAYTLQHHVPYGTGYGVHPPNPVDIALSEDAELDLAGLKVRAIRVPGHTYGSMGWMFTRDGVNYVAIGDLIMPGGVLGYSGSVNFSAEDVLNSLRKLARLKADFVLPGHGPTGDPNPYIAKGIEVGEATGWSRMTPVKPNPLYGFVRRDYIVAAWLEPIRSAAYSDVNGDGRPDVAILTPAESGSAVKIYLNKAGRFDKQPDCTVQVPDVEDGFKLRTVHLNSDRVADWLVSSERGAVLLVSQGGKLQYRAQVLDGLPRAAQAIADDFNSDGLTDCLIGQRFVDGFTMAWQSLQGRFRAVRHEAKVSGYFDVESADVDGDGRLDVLLSGGEIFRRSADGKLPDGPTWRLQRPASGWTFMAVGDFNGDRKPDVALLSQKDGSEKPCLVAMYYNTGRREAPFASVADKTIELDLGRGLLRDGPTAADFNGDGVCDLVVSAGQEAKAVVLLGSAPEGLSRQHSLVIELDYAIHHDTKLGVADFDGDGKADLAGFGASPVQAVGVYIRTGR